MSLSSQHSKVLSQVDWALLAMDVDRRFQVRFCLAHILLRLTSGLCKDVGQNTPSSTVTFTHLLLDRHGIIARHAREVIVVVFMLSAGFR